jgi:hypothetical protein
MGVFNRRPRDVRTGGNLGELLMRLSIKGGVSTFQKPPRHFYKNVSYLRREKKLRILSRRGCLNGKRFSRYWLVDKVTWVAEVRV